MVVAIMGIVLAIGIPSIFHMLNKESMVAAVRDVMIGGRFVLSLWTGQ